MRLTTRFDRSGFVGSLDLYTDADHHSFVSDHIHAVDHIIACHLDMLAQSLKDYYATVAQGQRTGDEVV